MEDYLIKALAKDEGIRVLACVTTQLANEGATRHKTAPTASAVLARGLTSAALFGALLKIKQRVAIKIAGSGPIGKMVVESNSYGRIRGYVSEPSVELPRQFGGADIPSAVGDDGLVTVVKDAGLKDLYQGIVPLVDGSIEQDLLHYLRNSEQLDSFMEIDSVLAPLEGLNQSKHPIAASGGVLVQALPGKDVQNLAQLGQRMEEIPSLANQIENGHTPEDAVAEIFGGMEYEVLEKRPLSFSCYCSWARTEKALLSIGRDEVQSLLDEGEAVLDCHFCGEQYVFGREALETILDKL